MLSTIKLAVLYVSHAVSAVCYRAKLNVCCCVGRCTDHKAELTVCS